MCGGGGGDPAAASRQQEMARQARIREGMTAIEQTFGKFDDGFYGDVRSGYMDYVRPDFDRQYKDAQEALAYQLARQGVTRSSIAAERGGDLQDEYQKQALQLEQNADRYVNQRKASVEDARNAVTAQLNSSADAGQAATLAVNRAAQLEALPAYDTLGNVFAQALTGLRSQAEAEMYGRNKYDVFGMGPKPSDPSRGASRVVR